MVNGTGVAASKYKPIFEHLASWGFIVIGNEDESAGNVFFGEEAEIISNSNWQDVQKNN